MKKVKVSIPWSVQVELYDHVLDEFYEEDYDYLPSDADLPDTDFVDSMRELGLINYVKFIGSEFWEDAGEIEMCIVFKASSEDAIKKAVEEITGQMSDGWGENGIESGDCWFTPIWQEITYAVEEL